MGIFNKSFADISNAISAGRIQGGLKNAVSSGINSLFPFITFKDLNNIKEYNRLVRVEGLSSQTAWNRTMLTSSYNAQMLFEDQENLIRCGKGVVLSQKAIGNAMETMTIKAKATELGLKAVSIAANMLVMYGISLAINAMVHLYNISDKLAQKLDETKSKLSSTTDEIASMNQELEDNGNKLSENQKRYEELIEKQKESGLTVKETNELQDLRNINKELTDQQAILKGNIALKKESAEATAQELLAQLKWQESVSNFFNNGFVDFLFTLNNLRTIGGIPEIISKAFDLPEDHWLNKFLNLTSGKSFVSFLLGADTTKESTNDVVEKYKNTQEEINKIRKKYDKDSNGLIDSDASMSQEDIKSFNKYKKELSSYAEDLQTRYEEIDESIKAIEEDPELKVSNAKELENLTSMRDVIAEILGYTSQENEDLTSALNFTKNKFKANDVSLSPYRKALENEYQKIQDWGLEDYEEGIKDGTIQSVFGNVDMDKRTIITWSDELKQTYKDELDSWDYDPEVGSIDTVFGGSSRFGEDLNGIGWEVAFTPILPDGTFLSQDTVYDYINTIITEAYSNDKKITEDELRKIDSQGRQIGNTFVKGIFAGIDDSQNYDNNGNYAETVGRIMHFSGDYGAVAIVKKRMEEEANFDWEAWFKENSIDSQEEIDKWIEIANAVENAAEARDKYINGEDYSTSKLSFEEIFNSEDFADQKESILELASAGELTPETLETTEEYKTLLTQTGLSAEECYRQIDKLVTSQDKLTGVTKQLSSLSDLYKQAKENGFVKIEDLSGLNEAWKNLDSYDNFVNIVGSGTYSMEEMQDAFNLLTSEFLTQNNALSKLSESNKDLYVQQLKSVGVTNALKIVEKKLADQYLFTSSIYGDLTEENKEKYIQQLKNKGITLAEEIVTEHLNDKLLAEKTITDDLNMTIEDFNDLSYESQAALLAEANVAEICRKHILNLQITEIDYSNNGLDVSKKIESLKSLALAYGIANTQAEAMAERERQMREYEEQTGANTGFKYEEPDYERAEKDLRERIDAQFAQLTNFDDIKYDGSNLEDSTKDSTDNIFDWIETRISRLQNAFQNMVDSVTKYVSQNFKLDSIDKQITSLDEQISTYYAGAEKYLEKANSITLSDDLRNKVINGKIEIEEISDETTREAVTEFKGWYEKYLDAIDNATQLERDKRDKLREKLDARTWALQQQRERLSTKSDRKQDTIDFKESLEGSANTSEYQWLINNADKQYENINAENSLLKEYLATLDSTSEEWADIQSQIESNESSMRDLISSQVEWNNKIAQMPIDKAEKAIEKLSGKEEHINAKYENTNSSWAKRQLNDSLADIKTDTLKQYRNAYETTKDNFNTSAWNINKMSSKDSLVAKVQKYTKSGKEIPSDVLTAVYNSGNTLLIRRCEQYNAAYLARETAKDTYDLNKEQIKTDLADLGQKNLDTITDAYANKNTTIDNKKSLINARKENTEAKGKYADESYYNQLLTQVSRQVDAKVSERNKLKEIIDQNIKDGLWTKESQMYKDAMAQVDQLGIEIVELSTEQANYNNELNQMPIDRLQTALDILDKLSSRDSSKNDLKKALGKDLSVDDYQKEFNNIKKQEDKTLQLRNKYYQKYINAKQKGRDADADKYLQLYYEEDTALNNLKVSFEELKDEMRDDVYWRDFERAHNAAENLKTTIASIIDLYSDEMLFSDNGALTDMGVSKMGALLKEYELAKTEVVNYTNDLKNLNNLYENGLYPNEEEYKEKLAEIKNGLLDATKETKSYNDALRDMVISQKEIELEALNELIDKRKEALNAKKEYYDYDKTIKEKTKEIQSLQAQVAALEGVETAEAKAQLARAKSELQEAQDDLEETKFDHKLEVILDGFDLLQTDLQENHDAYVKNLKSSFDEQIEIISNANSLIGQSYSEVIRSITNMLQFYGVDTSSIDVGSLAGFATGGIVRAVRRNGDSALVSVNPDETILTKKFTDLLPDTVQMMSQFVNIPKMNYDFAPRRNDTPVININYDKMLHIEGNVFDMEKATMDVVKNNMKTIAKGVSNDLSTQWRKLGHK